MRAFLAVALGYLIFASSAVFLFRVTKVDPHSPVRFRTLGTLRNYSEFAKAFGCKSGQAMVSDNSCRVW